jgi:hypothetical protein
MRLELVFSEQLHGTVKTDQPNGANGNGSGERSIKFVFDDEQEKEKTGGSLSYTPSRSSHGGTLTTTLHGEYILDRTSSKEEGLETAATEMIRTTTSPEEKTLASVRPPSHAHPSKREKSRESESRSQLRSAAQRYDSDFESEDNNYSRDEFDET